MTSISFMSASEFLMSSVPGMQSEYLNIDTLKTRLEDAVNTIIRREDIEQRRNKAIEAEKELVAERDRARTAKASAASTGTTSRGRAIPHGCCYVRVG